MTDRCTVADSVWIQLSGWIEKLLGLVFIMSAALKAVDITSFAIQVWYYGVVRDATLLRLAAFSTVGLETAIGIALLVGLRLRGWTFGGVVALLLGFTGLLLYSWAFKGLEDCGCFGKFIKMGLGVSVLKNLVMMALVVVAWAGFRKGESKPAADAGAPARSRYISAATAALCVMIVLGAFGYGHRLEESKGHAGVTPTRQAYENDRPFARFLFEWNGQPWDLARGEYLIVLLSDSCPHCAEAVEELNELPLLIPDVPPIVGLCLGDEETLEQFRDEVKPKFPTVLIEQLTFFEVLGDATAPPRFVYVRDGKEMRYWNEKLPDEAELTQVFGQSSTVSP